MDFEEFCNLEENTGVGRERLKELFAKFDGHRTGKLDVQQFRAYLRDGRPSDVSSWKQHWRKLRSFRSSATAFSGSSQQLPTDALNPPKPKKHLSSSPQSLHQWSFSELRQSVSGQHGASLHKSAADPHGPDLTAHQVAAQ